ncbi:hypothetical protein QP027_06160 [Corynebacterium breve]|uniref:NUDIX hydrolase n=1 Tax=Corynebacterium breve TaxID=3049799 RepID=A0ABY8VJ01_9CORY|nr:hypothetical protein [Corynebacterium breve]WIM69032.1 hypothetical protein QP027_06160 [Corynebacterium breve]
MSTTGWVVFAVVVTLFLAWAYSTAQRLDRLHVRVDRARSALESALNRRAAVIAAVSPDASEAARRAEHMGLVPGEFEQRAESERALRRHIAGSGISGSAELADADARVMLALRFYNDAVADTRAVRLRPEVKLLRLGGTARLPEFFELTSDEPN